MSSPLSTGVIIPAFEAIRSRYQIRAETGIIMTTAEITTGGSTTSTHLPRYPCYLYSQIHKQPSATCSAHSPCAFLSISSPDHTKWHQIEPNLCSAATQHPKSGHSSQQPRPQTSTVASSPQSNTTTPNSPPTVTKSSPPPTQRNRRVSKTSSPGN